MRWALHLPLALTLAATPSLAQQKQAGSGRIDIYVANSAFELSRPRGSYRTRVGHCSWLGEGKERTGVTCEKRLGKEWEEIWVEFVAEGDGEVDIDLQGEHYRKEGPNDVRLIWADDVTVTGAQITNASFEEVGPTGGPANWRFTGAFPVDRYSRDGGVAQDGASCVAVWWGGQARQSFSVEQGKTYRVAAWFRVVDPGEVTEPASVPRQFAPETYTQELEITFTSEDALRDEWFREDHPNLSYSMHAWYRTPEAWEKFGRHLDAYGHNADWWYCNQNEYAAYRCQYQQTKLEEPAREGKTVRYRIRRPVLLDVNDPTPLTFEVRGIPAEAVAQVKCATADSPGTARAGEGFRFNLSHDRDESLPDRIGLIHSRANRTDVSDDDVDADFPFLRALLHFADDAVRLTIENRGDEPLTNVRITYRAPPAWDEGVARRNPADIAAGGASMMCCRLPALPMTTSTIQQVRTSRRRLTSCAAPNAAGCTSTATWRRGKGSRPIRRRAS